MTLSRSIVAKGEQPYLRISDDDWSMWSQVLWSADQQVKGSRVMTKETLEEEMNAKNIVDMSGCRNIQLAEEGFNMVTYVRDRIREKLAIISWRINTVGEKLEDRTKSIATRTTIGHYEQSSSPNWSIWAEVRLSPYYQFALDHITPEFLACVPMQGVLSPVEYHLREEKKKSEFERLRERLVRREKKKSASAILGQEESERKVETHDRARRRRT